MNDYRYVLIRYVADPERMEPLNVGVILQGAGRVDVRLSPHAAKRKEIDTNVFRQWRDFFNTEIKEDAAPLFQPDRGEPAFLKYLEELCQGSVLLSRPLLLSTEPSRGFDDVLESLYQRLVAPPEVASHAAAARPTGRFRQLAEERQFVARGMRRHAHVIVGGEPLWMAYRQVLNGSALALDKVEVANQIGQTSNEIERLPLIAKMLPSFLDKKVGDKATRYVLLADELSHAFADQPEAEFNAMREDLEEFVGEIRKLGGEIVRSTPEAEQFVEQIDRSLPPVDKADR